MTLQDLVVSQPLAQQMGELGWKQGTSIFVWVPFLNTSHTDIDKWEVHLRSKWPLASDLAAPTFAEIWEKLPRLIENKTSYGEIDRDYYKILKGDVLGYFSIHSGWLISYANRLKDDADELWCWTEEQKQLKIFHDALGEREK